MENPNFIFSSGPIQLKEEGENFFVEGHISTSDLDLVNDIVTKDCIMDMAEQMRERTIKLDIEHESFRGNTDLEMEINKTIIPAAKIDDFLIDKKGLKVRAMLNKHVSRFNEVKNSIRDGFLDAFSIAFVPVESKNEIREGSEVRMLDKINLLNVAFTGNPVNTHSTMTNVFAKSLEFLEDQKAKPPKRPKPKDPHKESEEDEDEDEKAKGPGGHKPDKTGPHGRGAGPGGGRADGSGVDEDEEKKKKKKEEKDHNHSRDDIIKLQEVKNMTEDEDKKPEGEEDKKPEDAKPEEGKVEGKDEDPGKEEGDKPAEEPAADEPADKPADEPAEGSDVEGKDLEKLKADMVEVKAALKRPMLKSRVEQVNKTGIKEEKSLNPLDVIA